MLQPQDFHACFEACIGNRWFVFDATRLAPLNGLVRIATGPDAADASIATIFGGMYLQSMQVNSLSDGFKPLFRQDLDGQAVLLEP
jgi:transglutaminase-like putative cysteine protease